MDWVIYLGFSLFNSDSIIVRRVDLVSALAFFTSSFLTPAFLAA